VNAITTRFALPADSRPNRMVRFVGDWFSARVSIGVRDNAAVTTLGDAARGLVVFIASEEASR
jgi:hypothetical protein